MTGTTFAPHRSLPAPRTTQTRTNAAHTDSWVLVLRAFTFHAGNANTAAARCCQHWPRASRLLRGVNSMASRAGNAAAAGCLPLHFVYSPHAHHLPHPRPPAAPPHATPPHWLVTGVGATGGWRRGGCGNPHTPPPHTPPHHPHLPGEQLHCPWCVEPHPTPHAHAHTPHRAPPAHTHTPHPHTRTPHTARAEKFSTTTHHTVTLHTRAPHHITLPHPTATTVVGHLSLSVQF